MIGSSQNGQKTVETDGVKVKTTILLLQDEGRSIDRAHGHQICFLAIQIKKSHWSSPWSRLPYHSTLSQEDDSSIVNNFNDIVDSQDIHFIDWNDNKDAPRFKPQIAPDSLK